MPVGAALGGLGGKGAGVLATFLAGAAATVLLLVYFLSPHRADIFGP